jgi:DNA-binding PadR family transcriptional regulator
MRTHPDFDRHGHGKDHGFSRRHFASHGLFGRLAGLMGAGHPLRAARMLSSADLQLVILALLQEKPRHGYDLIKELEVRSKGAYVPSPGVIYPALTYLEEAEFAHSQADGNKKLFQITEKGREHLEMQGSLVDEILEGLARLGLKMARVQKHFADEDAESERDQAEPHSGSKAEWRKMKMEFRELKEQFKSALFEKINATSQEKARVMAILRRALEEIRGTQGPQA